MFVLDYQRNELSQERKKKHDPSEMSLARQPVKNFIADNVKAERDGHTPYESIHRPHLTVRL